MSQTIKLRIRGTGHLNGPIIMNKVIEVEKSFAKAYFGSKRREVLLNAAAVYYPGVVFVPHTLKAEYLVEERVNTSSKSNTIPNNNQSVTVFKKPYWMIPLRMLWMILAYSFRVIFDLDRQKR
jgi:hypothetical protein